MYKIIKKEKLNKLHYKLLADAILQNKLIIGPSDTVYGLYTIPTTKSILQIINFKGRNANKPISVFMHNIQHASKYIKFSNHIRFISQKLKDNKRYTFIVKASNYAIKTLPKPVITASKTIGIRIIKHEFITNIFKSMQKNFDNLFPITATSANISNTKPFCEFTYLLKNIPEIKLNYISYLVDYKKLSNCNNSKPQASTLIDISKGIKKMVIIKR